MKLPILIVLNRCKALLILLLAFMACKQSFAQPGNDLCGNATNITSSLSCITTAGTVANATFTAGPVACAGTVKYDVWYKFTATSANPSINLSAVGANFAAQNPLIQIFSGTCGALVSLGCGASPSYAVTGLTIGTVYYVRIYSTTVLPTPTTLATFNICIQDPAPPANDLCGSAVTLTSGATCTTTAGTVVNATFTSGPSSVCSGGTAAYDVWYKYTATSSNPTISLSSVGANFAAQNPLIQVFSGTCGTPVSVTCGASPLAVTGLTLGTSYLIRVFSITASPVPATLGTFNICIQDPPAPANDLCANAIALTSGLTCTTTTGTVANATFTAGTAAACAGTVEYDVWYSFTAQTTNPTITLSNIGANFTAQTPRVQVFSGTCGSFASAGCGTTSVTPTGLTVGAVYYVRVYSTTTNPIPATVANFDICVTDPPPPVNDNCTGATTLSTASTCSTTPGTLLNSTGTAGVPGDCGAVGSPEVWYKFVAQSVFPTITISGVGAQFTSAGPRIQILSGTCGSMTSLACVSGTSLDTHVTPGTPLTVGATYYVRIYTNTAGMSGTAWGFSICVQEQAIVDYGKAYVNITKGTSGGTVEPGDVLEIRAIYVVKGGTTTLASFLDTVPANTTYVPGTLRILTNEAQIYKQWTDAVDGDPAEIVSGSFITINLGQGATNAAGGTVKNTDRPTNFGSTCIMIVSYRVTVNAVAYGSPVDVGGGKVTYTNPDSYVSTVRFPSVTAIVYKNYGICANTIGSNGVLSEFGGTFGSGNAKDRATPSTKIPVNYTYIKFTTGTPGDYYYGLSNNSSPGGANYSINPNDPLAANHVFNVWDIIGDHTGAASPTAGNLPADTTGGKTGGYMVVINSAYRTDTAFLDTVRNLCPNTYYEYSAWFRNICRKCSGDSTGKGPSTVGYVPTGPGDSSGVHPNLTFNINGNDYYTTGDILYTGQWIKKGFTYLTGPSQTQMIINIRNNAPGGGGNDWAMDDIGVATCTPNLVLNPATPTLNVCYGDGTSLSADVRSYFNNYTEYIWEVSSDNGATYTSTGSAGSGTPVFNGTEYVYTAGGPSFIGDSTTNLNIYRLRVASSSANLSDTSCSFAAIRTVQVYVNNCLYLLKEDVIHVSGSLRNNNTGVVQWQTVNEADHAYFQVEKSTDAAHFSVIGTVQGNAVNGAGIYSFTDPSALTTPSYYRIKMIDQSTFKYGKTILLSPDKIQFDIKNLVNPFSNSVRYDVILPAAGEIRTTIFDNYGRAVRTATQQASSGITPVTLTDMGNLSSGIYTLKVEWQQQTISKRIIKIGQ